MVCLCKTLEERSCGHSGGLCWFFPPSVLDRAYHCNEEQFMATMGSYKILERYRINELLYCSNELITKNMMQGYRNWFAACLVLQVFKLDLL
ncbi:unnamed protein product, partial [Linum tenue]